MYEILLEFFRRLPYFFIMSLKFLRKFHADSLVYSESGPNFIRAKTLKALSDIRSGV